MPLSENQENYLFERLSRLSATTALLISDIDDLESMKLKHLWKQGFKQKGNLFRNELFKALETVHAQITDKQQLQHFALENALETNISLFITGLKKVFYTTKSKPKEKFIGQFGLRWDKETKLFQKKGTTQTLDPKEWTSDQLREIAKYIDKNKLGE